MSAPLSHHYALILAGGTGQRFWPVSRDRQPKQLLHLFGERSLLELTLSRLDGLFAPENILILTNQHQLDQVRAVATGIPVENILAEPEKRDTAPAIALAIGWVAAKDPEATMVVLPSDHLIKDTAAFQQVLAAAMTAAERSEAIVTVGIPPTWACPSYGYVERGRGAAIPGDSELPVYEVRSFREKPSPDLADYFLSQGSFTWNAGMFIWTLPCVIQELSRHCPDLSHFISELRHSSDLNATVAHQFHHLPRLSIDYALMEKASRVLNIEATFDWDDVGNWTSVARHLNTDDSGNHYHGAMSQLEAEGNIVFAASSQHVALLGVRGLIVVATPDAVLVTNQADAERIKRLVDTLPAELR
ncbi:MAG: mannose-1-phosphate guanylyltransferase [Verrucomicrobiales bacterium]|nr:mannose-1-phosphate guanylyltransferase [Verrucomicrobiales bacterium]